MDFVQTNPDFSSRKTYFVQTNRAIWGGQTLLSKQIKPPLIYLINRDLMIISRLKTH